MLFFPEVMLVHITITSKLSVEGSTAVLLVLSVLSVHYSLLVHYSRGMEQPSELPVRQATAPPTFGYTILY